MFIIAGGEYNGIDYSTMYNSFQKHEEMSLDRKHYFHLGIVEGVSGELHDKADGTPALLIFNTDSDKMVYAKAIPECAGKAYNKQMVILRDEIRNLGE